MNNDFVFNQIYKGALKEGASDRNANNAAVMGLDRYKKGRYQGKVLDLILSQIKYAKRMDKNASK